MLNEGSVIILKHSLFFCVLKQAFMGGHDHSNDHTNGGHGHDDHSQGVYKGLGAIVGIYVFFVIEKIMQMRRARKEKRVSWRLSYNSGRKLPFYLKV